MKQAGRGICDPNSGLFESRGARGRSFMDIAGISMGVNGWSQRELGPGSIAGRGPESDLRSIREIDKGSVPQSR